jgi:hypothetical protein
VTASADLLRLTEVLGTATALDAADALGVLPLLESGPASATTVAGICRITVRVATAPLGALAPRALRPGGTVAIVNILPTQDPEARRSVRL